MAVALALLMLVGLAVAEPATRACEPIRIELCRGLGYNATAMPNLGGNDLQQEADYTLKSFSPLIQYGCSAQLKLFLCSVYVPMCTEKVATPIGPCRGLCETVRSRCYPVLKGFGFPWPDALNCSRFPAENNHEHMCMEGPKGVDLRAPVDPATVKAFACPPRYATDAAGGCVPQCGMAGLFDDAEKRFAEVWVSVWALICLVSSVAALLTLLVGGGRVRAPPLTSVATCYVLVSAGWTMRLFSGRLTPGCEAREHHERPDVNCAFAFLHIYYFGMAANAWWSCLCAWWAAKVARQWSAEKMRTLESFLHLFAWGLPAVQTVVALVRRDVDADQLSGTCYVGNENPSTLLSLVLVPDAIYFGCGVTMLIYGWTSSGPRKPISAAAPLTASTPRKESDFLGAVCALYAIPSFCLLASFYYEYANKEAWLTGRSTPALWVFLLRYLMSLFVGVSSLFWIWSLKTVNAWRGLLQKIGPKQQLKVQTVPVLRYVPQSALSSGRHSIRAHPHRKPRLHHLRAGGETII